MCTSCSQSCRIPRTRSSRDSASLPSHCHVRHRIPSSSSPFHRCLIPRNVTELVQKAWNAIPTGTPLTQGDQLFGRLADNRFEKKQKAVKKAPAPTKKGGKGKLEGAKAKPIDISRVDIRVGQIVTVAVHPSADYLYVETIDIGEDTPRQVCSRLAHHIPLEQMEGARLCVIANMKPSNFRGVKSEAMVLAGLSRSLSFSLSLTTILCPLLPLVPLRY